MATRERPLSPHLQIYKWHLTMALSIVHRITGVALGLGACAMVWVLVSAAIGPEAYACAHKVLSCWVGQALLFMFTFGLFLHLCTGIRHLIWDVGYGFNPVTAFNASIILVVIAILLTVAVWVVSRHFI